MSKTINCAEAIDRMHKYIAWGMLICGITYFIVAAEQVFEQQPFNDYLDVARAIGVFLTVLVVFLGMWPVIRLKFAGKFMIKKEPESFMTEAMHASFKNSWLATMLFVVVLLSIQNKLDDLAFEISFYLIVLFGFMASSAALSFLYLTRNDGLDDLEEV
ncbi:MAG: hypothetical protein HWD86_10460 [Kangiellaceae bacterium]|nr:hypothetical protein [Kangiellaceae bacterium]